MGEMLGMLKDEIEAAKFRIKEHKRLNKWFKSLELKDKEALHGKYKRTR